LKKILLLERDSNVSITTKNSFSWTLRDIFE
jgi:hypothetical protein